jgi:hypothetical protein
MLKKIFTTIFVLVMSIAALPAFGQGLQQTLLPSANRFATTNTADQYATKDDKGITVFGVVSTLSTNTLTFSIQGKRPDGTYYSVLSSSPSAATGTFTLKLYPGMTAAANAAVSEALPPVFRVISTHTNGNTATYSIQVNRHK